MNTEKKSGDGSRLKTIGILILIVSVICFFIGQSKFSAADKELREYYGDGLFSDIYYEYDRAGYYLPGEQMRDYSVYGIVAGAALIISGIVAAKKSKNAPEDLLAKTVQREDSR